MRCPEIFVGALLTPLQTWPLVFVFFQRRAGLLGNNSQLITLVGLPVAAQVQPGQRRPGLATHLLLQEGNRLMAGTDWMVQERPNYTLILALQYNMQRKKSRVGCIQFSQTRPKAGTINGVKMSTNI